MFKRILLHKQHDMKLCWIFGLITHAFFNFGKLPWFQKFAALSCLVAVKTRGCGFNGEKVVQKILMRCKEGNLWKISWREGKITFRFKFLLFHIFFNIFLRLISLSIILLSLDTFSSLPAWLISILDGNAIAHSTCIYYASIYACNIFHLKLLARSHIVVVDCQLIAVINCNHQS